MRHGDKSTEPRKKDVWHEYIRKSAEMFTGFRFKPELDIGLSVK